MTKFLRVTTLVLALAATGCGHAVAPGAVALRASAVAAKSVPPQSAFTTITANVLQVMPDDNSGLPHQRFIVREVSPNAGQTLEVDNDTHYGQEVPGLAAGQTLTIRGVTYQDPGKMGIHWTHHASKSGDAGFIRTADGHTYQ